MALELSRPTVTADACRATPGGAGHAIAIDPTTTSGTSIIDLRDQVIGAVPTRVVLKLGDAATGRLRSLAPRISHWIEGVTCPLIDIAVVLYTLVRPYGFRGPSLSYAVLVMIMLRCGPPDWLRLRPSIGDDIPMLLRACAIPLLAVSPWLTFHHGGLAVLGTAPVLFVGLVLGRVVAHALVSGLRRCGVARDATIILGAGEVGQRLATSFTRDRRFGVDPVGFVDDNPLERLPLPVLGATADLLDVIQSTHARRVIAAYGYGPDANIVPVLRACDEAGVVVHVIPRFFELGVLPQLPHVDDVRGIRLVRLRRAALRPSSKFIKRTFDVVVATAALVVLSPLMVLISAAVWCSSGGPVLFKQERIGRGGRTINVIKFRSMTVDDASDTQWGAAAEARVTRLGAILRSTSLDELPQLVNVLKGEMSIVGPRPERPYFAQMFGESIRGYCDRHRVAAGLTGWSQIHGLRGDTSIADRANFDNFYVENWSLWLDLRIIFRTIRAVLPMGESSSRAPGGQPVSQLADLGAEPALVKSFD